MPLINFSYPVTNFRHKIHVGDLEIYAIVVNYSDGTVGGVQIMHVMWNKVDVMKLIEAVSPDEWQDIQAAALSHAEGKYGKKEESLLDTLYKIVAPKEAIIKNQ